MKANKEFKNISQTQKLTIEEYIDVANPKKAITILTDDVRHISVGQFKLIDDQDVIYKAIIEMLYCLRNQLFHGALTPSPGANKVYEAAYRILKQPVVRLDWQRIFDMV